MSLVTWLHALGGAELLASWQTGSRSKAESGFRADPEEMPPSPPTSFSKVLSMHGSSLENPVGVGWEGLSGLQGDS